MLLLNSIKFWLRTTQLLYVVIYPVFKKSPRPKSRRFGSLVSVFRW